MNFERGSILCVQCAKGVGGDILTEEGMFVVIHLRYS